MSKRLLSILMTIVLIAALWPDSANASDSSLKIAALGGSMFSEYPQGASDEGGESLEVQSIKDDTTCVDYCRGDVGCIHVQGWAYDPSHPSAALNVHVYLGGPAGEGEGFVLPTDKYRSDVNSSFDLSGNHGFGATIPTRLTGTQTIYFYAVNNATGQNIFMESDTVTITADTMPPTISGMKVDNLTTEGYRVSCTVNDNVYTTHVRFPSWDMYRTDNKMVWGEGAQSGSTWSYTVNVSDHDGLHGLYETHIYAYDYSGNHVGKKAPTNIIVPNAMATYGNSAYFLVDDTDWSWTAAKAGTEDFYAGGAHLVTIGDAREQAFVQGLAASGAKDLYWIGLSDADEPGTWVNLHGEGVAEYSNWGSGEPSSASGRDYAAISRDGGSWVSRSNDSVASTGYIMEIENYQKSHGDVVVDLIEGTYIIDVGASPSFALGIASESRSADAKLTLGTDVGGDSQRFRFTPAEDGSCKIVNVNSGLALQAPITSLSPVRQEPLDGSLSQCWFVEKDDAGNFYIRSKATGMYLDVAYAAYQNGTEVLTGKVSEYGNQAFTLKRAESTADIKAANAVSDMIDSLPSLDDLSLGDADDVKSASDAYDALSDIQKGLVEGLGKLEAARDRIAYLEEQAKRPYISALEIYKDGAPSSETNLVVGSGETSVSFQARVIVRYPVSGEDKTFLVEPHNSLSAQTGAEMADLSWYVKDANVGSVSSEGVYTPSVVGENVVYVSGTGLRGTLVRDSAVVTLQEKPDPTPIAKPIADDFVFDGEVHAGVAVGDGYELSGILSASAVGEYTVTATLLEGYQWADETTAPVNLTWKISPKGVAKPTTTSFSFDGENHYGVEPGEGYDLAGETMGSSVGTYTARVTLNDGYIWADGSSDDLDLTWTITPQQVGKPSASDCTYDGLEHVGVPAGLGYSLSGTTSAVEVGSYAVTATLVESYVWDDGTDGPVELSWSIAAPEAPSGGEGGQTGGGGGADQPADDQPAQQTGGSDAPTAFQVMHRLYNPNSGEHFYTASAAERDMLRRVGWRYEGEGWKAPAEGADVYRLYNPNAGDHHYTQSAAERDMLKRAGWRYEGVGWKSADAATGVPLYRQYNPNAKAGSHNYTTSKGENDMLVRAGWRAEGVGWYGIRVG